MYGEHNGFCQGCLEGEILTLSLQGPHTDITGMSPASLPWRVQCPTWVEKGGGRPAGGNTCSPSLLI